MIKQRVEGFQPDNYKYKSMAFSKNKFKDDIRAKLDQHKDWLQKIDKDDENCENGYDEQVEQQRKIKMKYKQPKRKKKEKRWERLYELNKLQNETKNYMKRVMEEEKDDDPECTFHPKISQASQQMVSRNNRPAFIERNETWIKQKNEKLKVNNGTREDKELLHCTFHPQINYGGMFQGNKKEGNIMKHMGVKKFLQRQEAARKEKLRKENKLKGGYKGKRKNKRLTIPIDPKLSSSNAKVRNARNTQAAGSNKHRTEEEIKNMYSDPNSVYPSRCTLHEAISTLHEHLNAFDIVFEQLP